MGQDESKQVVWIGEAPGVKVDVVARELERRRKTNAAATADLKRPPALTFPCVPASDLYDAELGGL